MRSDDQKLPRYAAAFLRTTVKMFTKSSIIFWSDVV
jgi:hypothetical protein